jgi:hypothetical protein
MIPKKPIRIEHEESERINRAIAALSKDRAERRCLPHQELRENEPAVLRNPWPFACSEPEYGVCPIECSHPTNEFKTRPFGATLDHVVGIHEWARCRS